MADNVNKAAQDTIEQQRALLLSLIQPLSLMEFITVTLLILSLILLSTLAK